MEATIYGLHRDLIPLIAECKEMWNISVIATYYDNAKIICELVEMKDCNSDAVLNKEECNAVISYLSTK